MLGEIKILDRRFVPAGQLVVEQGNIGNRAFMIESGRVEVFMRNKKGKLVKIAEAGKGAIIGEMALIDGGERSASIRTIEDSVLIAISSKDIEESIGDPEGVFKKMLKTMVQRLKETNAQLVAQKSELQEIEEAARMTVNHIGMHIPENKQQAFKRDVLPLLDKLKNTLRKYDHIS